MKKFLRTSGIYLLAGVLIFFLAFSKKAEKLSPKEFAEKVKQTENAQLIDVRTPGEFGEGHVMNAKNIDWNGEAFDQKVEKLDKQRPVFVYCHSGGRSGMAADRLKQLGFTQVYDMNGGMMKWRSAGLPVAGGAAVANKGMDRKEYNALLNDNRVVVVDFYAPWCGPCKKMAPYLDELSKSQASKLKIVRINTDEHLSISNELKVDALPTIYLYKNGKKIWEHVGYISKEDLMKQVNKNS